MSSGRGNGQLSLVPPGFRFHPTDEELLYYYLRKKVSYEAVDLDVIREVDLNRLEPWDLKDKCRIGSGIENEWYFFSHKDKKYPTGTRTNRATNAGFWKATGRDKAIYLSNANSKKIGMRKTLVFYTGRAPHGQKTDWIMHEYRLEDNIDNHYNNNNTNVAHQVQEDGWVVCRVFRKKLSHGIADDNITSNQGSSQLDHQPKTTQYNGDHDNEAQVVLGGGHFVSTNNISSYMKLPNNAPTPIATDHRLQNLFMLHEPSTCMHLPQLWSPESTTVPITSSHNHIHQNSYLTRPMMTNTTTATTNFSYDINRNCGGGAGDWSFLDKLLQATHVQNLRNEDNIITRFNYPNSLSLANVNDVSTSDNNNLSVQGSYTRFGASTPNPMF